MCFDKLAGPAAYRAVEGGSPEAALALGLEDVRRLGRVQRYAMPQYVLLYRPGRAEVRCVGERGVVVYLNVLVYVSA
jgi:hypothetical protein